MQYETKFRKEQAEAKKAYKHRGKVLWVSCKMISPFGLKEKIQGTFRYESGRGIRGKAIKKASKRLTHRHHHYAYHRAWLLKLNVLKHYLV